MGGPVTTSEGGETPLTQEVDNRVVSVARAPGSAGYVRPKGHARQSLVQWADSQGRPADSRPAQVRARMVVEGLFAELPLDQQEFVRRWFLADPPMSLATIATGLDVSERAVETRVAELARALEWSDVYSCAQTVFGLRPELVQLGRGAWCDQVMRHLDLFARHAGGAGEAGQPTVVDGEPDEQPRTSDMPDDRLPAELRPPADENFGVPPLPSAPPRNSGHTGGLSSQPPAPSPATPGDAASEMFGPNWARGLDADPVVANPFGRFGRALQAVDGATTHAAGAGGVEGGGLGSGKQRSDAASQQVGGEHPDTPGTDHAPAEEMVDAPHASEYRPSPYERVMRTLSSDKPEALKASVFRGRAAGEPTVCTSLATWNTCFLRPGGVTVSLSEQVISGVEKSVHIGSTWRWASVVYRRLPWPMAPTGRGRINCGRPFRPPATPCGCGIGCRPIHRFRKRWRR